MLKRSQANTGNPQTLNKKKKNTLKKPKTAYIEILNDGTSANFGNKLN